MRSGMVTLANETEPQLALQFRSQTHFSLALRLLPCYNKQRMRGIKRHAVPIDVFALMKRFASPSGVSCNDPMPVVLFVLSSCKQVVVRGTKQIELEKYRSGHNGTDSKSCPLSRSSTSENLEITRLLCYSIPWFSPQFSPSVLSDFQRSFERVTKQIDTERYRSGHNGADSKSV